MATNNVPTAEQIADSVREHLTSAYICTRVWEAWNVGTMGQDDFIEASETEMGDEIAAAVIERFAQPAMPADSVDAERYRAIRQAAAGEQASEDFVNHMELYGKAHFMDFDNPTPDEFDVAVDHARRRIEAES